MDTNERILNAAADTTAAIAAATEADGDSNDSKFLTFRLGEEEYGVEILRVREIIGVIDITPLPQTPDYVRGVINLRGKIIPVMELRKRFSLESIDYTDETCIIVVEVGHEEEDRFQMGVIVDTVNEVLDIDSGNIEAAPKFGCSLDTDFILGMGKTKDKVITLLDINSVLSREDAEGIGQMVDAANAPAAEAA